jgi:3-hydroxyacyl-CoA dehydrogenase
MQDSLIQKSMHGNIAVVTLTNPPVNSLSAALRNGLAKALSELKTQPLAGVVIAGAGRHFSAGADINEFERGLDPDAIDPNELHALIESMPCPVVAALTGSVLGGGFELALACHARTADGTAKIALPEVKLGLLPGGGGTQRLPRIASGTLAAKMIASGSVLNARAARDSQLIDRLGNNAIDEAIAYITNTKGHKPKATSERPVASDLSDAIVEERKLISPRQPWAKAAQIALESLSLATRMPFEKALQEERVLFLGLMKSAESKALRHLFFAERAAARTPGVTQNTKTRAILEVGVIGAGTMGSGIAIVLSNAGIPVTLIERNEAALEAGLKRIKSIYTRAADKREISQEEAQARMARIVGVTDMETLAQADLIIEAAFEEMTIKRDIFSALNRIAKPSAILATNTSALDVNVIAQSTERASDIVGLHFFSPAHVMKLLEIVRADKTATDVLATVIQLSRRLGKTPVIVGVCDGFLANRLLYPYLRQADLMMEEGATPEQIDRVLTEFGLAMGPCSMLDMAGQDIAWHVRQRQLKDWDPKKRYSRLADLLVEKGRLGSKTQKGWYCYSPDGRTKEPDPEVQDMIVSEAKARGIARRSVPDQEILERTLLAAVNEGAFALMDGTVQHASDIDIAFTQGLGFPASRGGPMHWADTLGLDHVYAKIIEFGASGDANWMPAPLLERLAKAKKSFSDYDRERAKTETAS